MVIKQADAAGMRDLLELGAAMPSAQYWADRWILQASGNDGRQPDNESDGVFAHEYVDGVSLTEFVKRTGPLPLPKILTLVAALEAAETSHPEAAAKLTPDRALFTAGGAPKFLIRDGAGVGPSGCLWYALTSQRPPRQRLSISLVRDDLPRALRVVVDAYMKGDRTLTDVRLVLQRLAAPEPLQLSVANSVADPRTQPASARRRFIWSITASLFTVVSVLLAGWQLQERLDTRPEQRTLLETRSTVPVDYGWDSKTCLWDRLAIRRQAALEGRASVHGYTVPGSAAAKSEHQLQEKLRSSGIVFSGLSVRLVPGQHDGRECVDTVGLFDWLPVHSQVSTQELQVFSLISGHQQRDAAGVVREVKPVKQQLSVQLRLHRGRWLISTIAVADEHAQALS